MGNQFMVKHKVLFPNLDGEDHTKRFLLETLYKSQGYWCKVHGEFQGEGS